MEYNDIVDRKFQKLIVKRYIGIRMSGAFKKHYYLCICTCGAEIEVERGNLLNKHTKSCGCLKRRKGKDNLGWKGFEDISARYWRHIEIGAKERKLSFNIAIEDAWTQFIKQGGCCALTGLKLNLLGWKGNYSNQTASLDRIDSSKGYERGNIQWTHKDVNLLRSNYPLDYFINICTMVANYAKR